MAQSKNPDQKSVLMVCTANQCRSPMAAALLKQLVQSTEVDPDRWKIDSAGTWGLDGVPATRDAIQAIAAQEIDLSNHRSKIITQTMLAEFNLVLTMEAGQKEALQIEFPNFQDKIFMLSEMSAENITIQDPTGKSLQAHHETIQEISRLIRQGMDQIRSLA